MKPLSEWTLAEVKAECKKHGETCDGCKLDGATCCGGFDTNPSDWDLEPKPKLPKPRLAEILGVEVGERFLLQREDGTKVQFWVTESGQYATNPPMMNGSSYMMIDAINNPALVIKPPKLTKPELAICKAVGAKWVTLDSTPSDVCLWKHKPVNTDPIGNVKWGSISGSGVIACIGKSLFPSVHPGDCIEVNDGE